MNRRIIVPLAILLTLAVAPLMSAQTQEEEPPDDLDQAYIEVKGDVARAFLGTDRIPVRRRATRYMPKGEVPVAQLAAQTEEDLRASLAQVVARHSGEQAGKVRLRREGPFLIAGAGPHRYWASPASGAYKFTDVEQSMAEPSRLGGHEEALQLALDYVAEHGLVKLDERVRLDVIIVSAVMNALTEVGQETPKESFYSDYYVIFGQRVGEVPVIGARLMVRLNGEGKVAALERHWPEIAGISEQPVKVAERPLEELIADSPLRERYSEEPLKAEEIKIVDRRCGYLAAPVSARQRELRPGCVVSFRIGDRLAESYPQMIVPLEEGVTVEQLWQPAKAD
jgi:hypothetical protein